MVKEEVDHFRELGPGGRTLTPSAFVGVSTLPDQFVNLQLKKGFCFNIMCIGASGVGKTSLLHTLFRRPFSDDPHSSRSEDVSLVINNYDLKEGNVCLKVSFIESRGFGDQVNKTSSTTNIVKYINDQYQAYLTEETKIKRGLENYNDKRVHVCIYMISPTGHSLNALDILTMKELHTKVNLIPIIGKADILTKNELKDFKTRINKDLREHGIQIYHFPTDDPTIYAKNGEMNERMPFAVVASAEEETINNQLCRVRKYPWGTVIIDDDQHCEFQLLREMILRSNLYDLIRTTHDRFYEDYRVAVFTKGGIPIDAEITETIRKKCAEITQTTNKEIDQLRLRFEQEVAALEEKYRKAEQEAEQNFKETIQEIENRKATVVKSPNEDDNNDSSSVENNESIQKIPNLPSFAERAENIVRELRRFKTVVRRQSSNPKITIREEI